MRVVPVVALLCLLILSTFAVGTGGQENKFAECPSGYDCSPNGDPYPPNLVTGHTVFAKWIMTQTHGSEQRDGGDETARFPSPPVAPALSDHRARPAPPGPQPASIQGGGSLVQAECVAWKNGQNLDVRPATVASPDGETVPNGFFSDEDLPGSASQDFDPGRALGSCVPGSGGVAYPPHHGRPTDFAAVSGYFRLDQPATPWSPESVYYGSYAVVVEQDDCRPATGVDFRYRGHLDFVDPNGHYHEVQEYDYVCGGTAQKTGPGGNHVPAGGGITSGLTADAVKDLFPLTGTDPRNDMGCNVYESPASTMDPSKGNDTGHFDLGHKCNGSVQDLFTERLWITPIHAPVWDPTIQGEYTFALVADTCSGQNIAEGWPMPSARDVDALDFFLDQNRLGQPLVEVCHDGSSFSFDDTDRGRTTHSGPPADEEETKRGNAYDFDQTSMTFGMHRNNCRHNQVDWSWNAHPGRHTAQGGPAGIFGKPGPRSTIGDDCFPEDHKAALIDIYVFDSDPTGLFTIHTNGLTGVNGYGGDPATGPDWIPEERAAV